MGIDSIKDYFISMEHTDGSWVISVRFKENWSGYSSDDGKINAIEDEDKSNKGLWWYYGKDTEASPDEIFKLIKETIDLNIEMAKKAELFTQKANELKDIFSNPKYSYGELKSLNFTFGEIKKEEPKVVKETKKKPARKTKKDVLKEIKVVPDNVDMGLKEAVSHIEATPEMITNTVVTGKTEFGEAVVNATDMTEDEINDLRG